MRVQIAIILAALTVLIGHGPTMSQDKSMKYNELTPEEEHVIVHKGTEKPFSGKYYQHPDSGTYVCKRCNAPLYQSDAKFDSRCGWPSFDDEIPGAVTRTRDADGHRTEITCTNCGGHLGHVFLDEGYTEKNVRHCVNSISLDFIPAKNEVQRQTAYFAGGCFWGVEYSFRKADGVIATRVGYMGGSKQKPTYREVCSGSTGHAESIEVIFDPAKTTFEKLARLFFEIHDPTQMDRQGPDIGEQYRSVIYYVDDEQKQTAQKLIGILKDKGLQVVTQLVKAGEFWEAEEYHQDYYLKTGKQPYCHGYVQRF